jgi:hypothetical protein
VILLRPLAPLFSYYAARYIERTADQHRRNARKLTVREFDAMAAFFPADLLHRARIATPAQPLRQPRIQKLATIFGMETLLTPEATAAITFNHVIAQYGPLSLRTLFHELVHVEQYKQLGVRGFAALYVRGFLRTGAYGSIPLEMHAYELDGRYAANPALRFSVRDEVRRWIAEGKY